MPIDYYNPDYQMSKLIRDTIHLGYSDVGQNVRPTYITDGKPAYTKYLLDRSFYFPPTVLPLITQKRVAVKTAIREILWIWQMKSNDVEKLREELGVNVWNEWERKDGTIGKAYGYQMGKKTRQMDDNLEKLDQVDFLLYALKKNPMSRRHLTSLWNIEDLDDMELQPCVYETHWIVTPDNKVHLIVTSRSSDIALGLPFNIFQYSILHRMVAIHTGYDLGGFTFRMDIPHIYDRHEEKLEEQISRKIQTPPKLFINPEKKNFYDFTAEDFTISNYVHGDKIDFELAE